LPKRQEDCVVISRVTGYNLSNHSPTALIANSLSNGLVWARYDETGKYNWSKQYMAMETEMETITVICR